jgi:glyoxylase-like metal-dependent hydrolase (beta-lactamase superfamily II)
VVGPRIRLVLAPNPSAMTGEGTNTFLVGDHDLAVIDPGPALPEHLDAILAEAGAASVRAIFVTHHHSDHLPAALPLAQRTGARLYGHPDLPGVHHPLGDEAVVEVGGFHFRALATPGHTPEHCSYWLEEANTIFCGDLMAGSGTVVVGSGEGELAQYLASLRRVLAYAPAAILPGHGPAIKDPATTILEYLDHRQMREDQIIDALAGGLHSVPDLRAAIYADVPAALSGAAENNVRAHLLKLRAEGRVTETSGRWALMPDAR